MVNDMKSGVGFIIPAAGVVSFFTSLFLGEFLVSIIIAVAGILVWFLYMMVMESNVPQQMGNMIMLFGILLSIGIFFGFGVTKNMWGGFEFQTEGSIFALVILFFAVLTGFSFQNQSKSMAPANQSGLSDSDRDLVMNAIKQTSSDSETSGDPRVIVVKQEVTSVKEEVKEEQPNPNDPYGMANNPYFAYPPDYYDEDDDDDDDWDEDDDDDEEDE